LNEKKKQHKKKQRREILLSSAGDGEAFNLGQKKTVKTDGGKNIILFAYVFAGVLFKKLDAQPLTFRLGILLGEIKVFRFKFD